MIAIVSSLGARKLGLIPIKIAALITAKSQMRVKLEIRRRLSLCTNVSRITLWPELAMCVETGYELQIDPILVAFHVATFIAIKTAV
jgi:hypothetical protein